MKKTLTKDDAKICLSKFISGNDIDFETVKFFAKKCKSLESMVNKMIEIVQDQDNSSTDKLLAVALRTACELSFQNRLSFRYAFELEISKKNLDISANSE